MLDEGKKAGKKFTIDDLRTMLRDSYRLEAEQLKPWFQGWSAAAPSVERARAAIARWDNTMRRERAAAALFETWRARADLDAIRAAPAADRPALMEAALSQAIQWLSETQGSDPAAWRWGRIHRSVFRHPLISAFDLPTVERDGGADTVNATGAVYRLITDFSDPDKSLVTIGPGLSGQPGSPFCGNLLDDWANGALFPLAYTRPAVERVTQYKLLLEPAARSSQ